MARLSILELTQYERADLLALRRKGLEDLAWRFRELARPLANRLGEDSTTSSRSPSSDDPYRRDQRDGKPPAGQEHGAERKGRRVSVHHVSELDHGDMGLQVTASKHSHFAASCACGHESVVEEVRASEVLHLDEAPWYQQGTLLWLRVVVSANSVVYRIGSRRKDELVALIGHAFLDWMVTDGYMACRDHPHRQRCLAHLIRKALALAEGYYGPGFTFGRDLVRDLRRLIERVRDGDNDAAEQALRHAVIARRISFGTRTDAGSRFYAAGLAVIDTCRKRGVGPWAYGRNLIAAARKGSSLPSWPLDRGGNGCELENRDGFNILAVCHTLPSPDCSGESPLITSKQGRNE